LKLLIIDLLFAVAEKFDCIISLALLFSAFVSAREGAVASCVTAPFSERKLFAD